MAKLERTVKIKAPADKVFSYLTKPENRIKWLPGTTDVRNIMGEGLGQRWDYTYRVGGRNLKGTIEVIDFIPGKRYAHKSLGGVVSTWTYAFNPEDGGTELILSVDLHSTPLPLIGKIVEKQVIKRGEQQADLAIANIKKNLEE